MEGETTQPVLEVEKDLTGFGKEDLNKPKEISVPTTYLGEMFETMLSALDYYPAVLPASLGASGLLATNEDLPDTTIQRVRNSEFAPNGYVYGAGFGNILSMLLLYPNGEIPKAIFSVDILPEVVATGRTVTRILASSDGFLTFLTQLRNPEVLRNEYQKVLNDELNSVVRQRLQAVTFEQLQTTLLSVLSREHLPQEGIRQTEPIINHERISVLAVLRANFDRLHELAKNGNIGVGYADMTNHQVLNIVKEMPEFAQLRNVFYLSNVIDHLTNRGEDTTHINDLNALGVLGEGEERGNWFVDTTQVSQNYKLRANHSVPKYDPSELI